MPKVAKHSYKPILSILGISLIITAAFLISQRLISPEPIGINEVASNGTVSLYASPTTLMVRPNVEKIFSISAVAGSDRLTAVELELIYDPTAVVLSNFVSTNYLSTTLISPTISNGKAYATFGAAVDSGGIPGSGSVATIKVKTLKPGTTTVNFGPSTLATATSLSTNALQAVYGTTIQSLFPGDTNGDNKVTLADYSAIISSYGQSGEVGFSLADFDNNGKIDLLDYSTIISNYGKTY